MNDYLKEEYKYSNNNCVKYQGFSFKENGYEEYLYRRVKDKFEDAEWNETLIAEAVKMTGFSEENFVEIFENQEEESYWRIGEVLAECVLEDFFAARFYYNSSRDAKNLRSNLTGADLVGFCNIDNDTCFLFGEVKTSSDGNNPPNVLYGKTGMIKQLEKLKDDNKKRHQLVKWIFSKSVFINGAFGKDCKDAMQTYIKSQHEKVYLFGVLVRDTEPNERDLKARARSLSNDVPLNMKLQLLSLYTGLKKENKNWEKAMNRGV